MGSMMPVIYVQNAGSRIGNSVAAAQAAAVETDGMVLVQVAGKTTVTSDNKKSPKVLSRKQE